MTTPAPHALSATLGGLAAIVLWSSTIAVARSLSEQLGPLTAGAAVYLAGGVVASLHAARRGALHQCHRSFPRGYLPVCGALFVLYTVLLFAAVGLAASRQQVLGVGMLNYLWPSLTLLLSLPLNGCRARWTLAPGLVLAFAGVVVVLAQGGGLTWDGLVRQTLQQPWPVVFAALAAVAWALYSNLARRLGQASAQGAVPVFLLATGAVLLCLRLLVRETSAGSLPAAGEALALGTITALAYSLWDTAMRRGHLGIVAACSNATPLLSTLLTCAYLGLRPGPALWLGCALLVAGSALSAASVRDAAIDKRP